MWIDGDTGNCVIAYNSDVSGNIDETKTALQVEGAMESSAAVVDCTVTGEGTRKDPWIISMVDPATDDGLATITEAGWVNTVVDADRAPAPGDRAPDRP
jgi:hypothetical protein